MVQDKTVDANESGKVVYSRGMPFIRLSTSGDICCMVVVERPLLGPFVKCQLNEKTLLWSVT